MLRDVQDTSSIAAHEFRLAGVYVIESPAMFGYS
jgi:hypothetical protein